jgi:hypothetical protein
VEVKIRVVIEIREGHSLRFVTGDWQRIPPLMPISQAVKFAAQSVAETLPAPDRECLTHRD